jgi:hypothetical protein
MTQYISVGCYEKGFRQADILNREYHDSIEVAFLLKNSGPKDIKAFKGQTVFKDLFGTEVYQSGFMYDEGLKAGETKRWLCTVEYNEFSSQMRKFRNAQLENMKFEWRPTAIIFSDGTKIGLEGTSE